MAQCQLFGPDISLGLGQFVIMFVSLLVVFFFGMVWCVTWCSVSFLGWITLLDWVNVPPQCRIYTVAAFLPSHPRRLSCRMSDKCKWTTVLMCQQNVLINQDSLLFFSKRLVHMPFSHTNLNTSDGVLSHSSSPLHMLHCCSALLF